VTKSSGVRASSSQGKNSKVGSGGEGGVGLLGGCRDDRFVVRSERNLLGSAGF
jgi:hypothetical protein